jgi:uncharacterized membrane protein YfcA
MNFLNIVRGGVGVMALWFAYVVYKESRHSLREKISKTSWGSLSLVGIITIFFDTLGIGSYAPQTTAFKFFKMVPDRLIPGTLNTANVIPMAFETLIFLTIIKVEPITLISIIAAATIGAVFGAGIVSKLPEKKIQIGMGIALLVVAFTITAGQLGLMPAGGEEIGLTGTKLIIAVLVSLVLGALMTIGIGCYAPMMALVYSLGMSPRVSFPIMMGACAFLIPAAGIRFVKSGVYDLKATIAISLAGLIGAFVAAYIVKEIPLTMLKWLVVAVITYASVVMLRSGLKNENQDEEEALIV